VSYAVPLEDQRLSAAHKILGRFSRTANETGVESTNSAQLEVLEATSSRLGGFSFTEFREQFPARWALSTQEANRVADEVLHALRGVSIHPSLALAALARPHLDHATKRRAGAYYTDFRLAKYLATQAKTALETRPTILDPACGTGILLVAAVLQSCGSDRMKIRETLRARVFAADRSDDALRGARLALASLTDDLNAVAEMTSKWRAHDSLTASTENWPEALRDGVGLIVANPPWEKLKLSRHEHLQTVGVQRHYGADYDNGELHKTHYEASKLQLRDYAAALQGRYPILGAGELDLYQAFLELFLRLLARGGTFSALVPAGLIRSQGTAPLREELLSRCDELDFVILENRARFFSIDSRFKFIAVCARVGHGVAKQAPIRLRHATGTEDGIAEGGSARISRQTLRALRPDLTLPEVRSETEWRLYVRICDSGDTLDGPSGAWSAHFAREVDMTKERPLFVRRPDIGALPVIEGRMIHQHRFGAKSYVSGTGRRARWDPVPFGHSLLLPQYWIGRRHLRAEVVARIARARVGFCDITGQTNERTMLAARIPAGVVCGNKVPTILFGAVASDDHDFLWLAIVNSFVFDWMIRRVVTTTVNYFLLRSVPLPRIDLSSLPARRLIDSARQIDELARARITTADAWAVGEVRACIDAGVACAYGLSLDDMELILSDFPLLDRAQPPLPGESRSTITRDLVLLRTAQRLGAPTSDWARRVEFARETGALPFVPSQFGESDEIPTSEALDA
jgi:SAM-dependent methyltransferase